MHSMQILLMMLLVPLAVSVMCWWIVGRALHRMLAYLCNDPRPEVKEIGGRFWQRLYLSLTVLMPLLCVLLFAPNFERGLDSNLLYALRWSVFGGVSLLLTLAYLVRRQIQLLQQESGVAADVQAAEVHDLSLDIE
ncbi:MAG: hypothetical protein Q4G42_09120 [Neisseria sp.]|nr:hypothetical protein [Neisseria sp.]